MIQKATIAHVYPTKVWIESDMMGARHVVMQHQDGNSEPFTYATFHYDYAYTSNAGTYDMATSLARRLGATDPIQELPSKMEFTHALARKLAQNGQ